MSSELAVEVTAIRSMRAISQAPVGPRKKTATAGGTKPAPASLRSGDDGREGRLTDAGQPRVQRRMRNAEINADSSLYPHSLMSQNSLPHLT
jgi:hypothetical protein